MSRAISREKRHLFLNIGVGIGYLVAFYPSWTGLLWHEWLGVAVGGALVTHLVLHWGWVVAITRRLLGTLAARARIKYAVDGGLLAAFLVLTGSGVVISSVLDMPYRLGFSVQEFALWIRVHAISADITVALVLLHLALHWKWIVEQAKRFLPRRRRMFPDHPVAEGSAAMERAEAGAD